MAVFGVPDRGETTGSKSFVGPADAHAGATAARTSRNAAIDATIRTCPAPPMGDLDGRRG
jgi:hypothetical protein